MTASSVYSQVTNFVFGTNTSIPDVHKHAMLPSTSSQQCPDFPSNITVDAGTVHAAGVCNSFPIDSKPTSCPAVMT